jgi:hypothetical protein
MVLCLIMAEKDYGMIFSEQANDFAHDVFPARGVNALTPVIVAATFHVVDHYQLPVRLPVSKSLSSEERWAWDKRAILAQAPKYALCEPVPHGGPTTVAENPAQIESVSPLLEDIAMAFPRIAGASAEIQYNGSLPAQPADYPMP